MEIIKQLYDIGNLFEDSSNLVIIEKTFNNIADAQLQYRQLPADKKLVINDIIQTSLCLSTRGKAGNGKFEILADGVSKIKPYIFSESYQIEKAIIHAARAAYVAKLIELQEKIVVRFKEPLQIKDWLIDGPLGTKLNKLKKSNPEAFYYWYQINMLIKKQLLG